MGVKWKKKQRRALDLMRGHIEYVRFERLHEGMGADKLSSNEMHYIHCLGSYPKTRLTQKDLGRIFGHSPSTVFDVVQNLVRKGYLETSQKRQRSKPLRLTDKGRKYHVGHSSTLLKMLDSMPINMDERFQD